MKISGNIIDIFKREIYPAEVQIYEGYISKIVRIDKPVEKYIMPGLIDSHIHIESSMVTPGSFAAAAVSRGTTAVVSDPHEIANVLGIEGVRYMIEDARKVPLKFFFGAPSCVPATIFETNGASIDHQGVEDLLEIPEIKFLSEMMNYPGVLHDDPEVVSKISSAKKLNKPIDGHAPGLSGEDLRKYIAAGITTDHECSSMQEAVGKIKLGMKVLMREGSAARNLTELKELLRLYPDMVMLCSDDLHPDMLIKGHINKLVARLINDGYDVFDVIRSCTLNPAKHYGLNSGLLQPGDPADFIVVGDYRNMEVSETWINGIKVFDGKKVRFKYKTGQKLNKFNCSEIRATDIKVKRSGGKMRVIEAVDGELITGESIVPVQNSEGYDLKADILKIIVKDRYRNSPAAVAFIRGFGLKSGAFASSIAHDSHNIICVGTNDNDIVDAVNKVINIKGGLAVAERDNIYSLQLDIAGILSGEPVKKVAASYRVLTDKVRKMGCKMASPFMTLSFMALLVIPALKLSDKGLFDATGFKFTPLFID
jgi:adenine deaminase